MKSLLTTIIFTVCGLLLSQAQDNPFAGRRIGLQFGWGKTHVQDQVIGPVNLRGGNIAIGLHYQHESKGQRRIAQFQLHNGGIAPDAKVLNTTMYKGSLSYEHLFQVSGTEDQPFAIWLGPALRTDLQFYDFNGLSSASWKFSHSLDASAMADYRVSDKGLLQGSLSMPMISSVVRPPYAGFDERIDEVQSNVPALLTDRGQLNGFWDNFVIRAGIGYTHGLSDRFLASANWQFEFQSYNQGRNIRSFSNHIQLGIDYQLR
ncbi:MAG: hypothetical protein AAF206_05550 [Bacteroidota bacterium]